MKLHSTCSHGIAGLTAGQINALLPREGAKIPNYFRAERAEVGEDDIGLILVRGANMALTFRFSPHGAEYVGTELSPLERKHSGEIPECRFVGVADVMEKDHHDKAAAVVGQALIIVRA